MNRRVQARRTRGTVLLTVLAMVAALSAIAVSMVDDIRFGIRRASNLELREQAFWYGLGAEEFARQIIRSDWEREPATSTLQDIWAREGARFAVDGGYVDGVITDAGNCFNLNSVVEAREGGGLVRREDGAEQFRRLLEALDFGRGDAERLTGTLVDWIDSDEATGPRGAEDSYYAGRKPPYRTANTLIADVTELRAIRDFDEAVYRRLRPFVCAHPGTGPARINANTLPVEKAALLVMLAGDDLSVPDAEDVLRDRSEGGYSSEDVFWTHDSFAGIEAGPDIREQLDLKTTFYELRAEIFYYDAYFAITSMFELKESGKVELVMRQWGDRP